MFSEAYLLGPGDLRSFVLDRHQSNFFFDSQCIWMCALKPPGLTYTHPTQVVINNARRIDCDTDCPGIPNLLILKHVGLTCAPLGYTDC